MSYNSGSNRARNFKSASRFALGRFRNYSPDYSLNCTPLGPITITNKNDNNNNNNKITSAGAKALNLLNSHNNLTQCDYLSMKTNRIIKRKNKALLKSNLYKRSTLTAAKSPVKNVK